MTAVWAVFGVRYLCGTSIGFCDGGKRVGGHGGSIGGRRVKFGGVWRQVMVRSALLFPLAALDGYATPGRVAASATTDNGHLMGRICHGAPEAPARKVAGMQGVSVRSPAEQPPWCVMFDGRSHYVRRFPLRGYSLGAAAACTATRSALERKGVAGQRQGQHDAVICAGAGFDS